MKKEFVILLGIIILVVAAFVIGSNYYQKSIQQQEKSLNSGANAIERADASVLINPDSAALGPANAPITIVEFYDPECESCKAMHPIVKKILKDYDGKIRLVMRYMPLHSNSLLAAQVTEAAGEQGKYWQMQDLLFQRQQEWGEKQEAQTALFEKYATELGIHVDQVRIAIAENRYAAKIERDKRDGQSLGVRSTPTFFVNGRKLLRLGEQELKAVIDDELVRQKK